MYDISWKYAENCACAHKDSYFVDANINSFNDTE